MSQELQVILMSHMKSYNEPSRQTSFPVLRPQRNAWPGAPVSWMSEGYEPPASGAVYYAQQCWSLLFPQYLRASADWGPQTQLC